MKLIDGLITGHIAHPMEAKPSLPNPVVNSMDIDKVFTLCRNTTLKFKTDG